MSPLRTALLAMAAVALTGVATIVGTGPTLAGRPLGGSSELRCTQKGSIGLIVTSDRPVACVFYRPDGAVEFYTGDFHRVGLDIGPANALNLSFRVGVPGPIVTGALDGAYGGVGAQITAGHGVGTDALVGGASGTATLTPIANEYLTGLNFNAGLGVLELHYRGMERERYR